MSTISSGVGLISGLPISDLVDSMMAVYEKPVQQLQQRVSGLTTRRTALAQISAQLLSIQNIANRLAQRSSFFRSSAASSNESAILASASSGAVSGQYTFRVRNLAAVHQLISGGFTTRDATPVGAGTVTFESVFGTVNRSTSLSELNGGVGVRAGKIRITDRAGTSAEIDLRSAATIDEVVDAINTPTTARVSASVDGDRLILADQTGLATGSLTVAEVGGGHMAADLGWLVASVNGVITGRGLVGLSEATSLDDLNDGNGVRVLKGQKDLRITLADGTTLDYNLSNQLSLEYRDNGDGTFTDLSTPLSVLNRGGGVSLGRIRVTNRAGVQTEINLSGARTIRDLTTSPGWAAAGVSVTVSGGHLVVKDNSGSAGTTVIEDVDGTTAAALGITSSSSTGTITGGDIHHVETVGDVIRIINAHADNRDGAGGVKLLAAVASDRPGLMLTDATTGGETFRVEALNGSQATSDLGLLVGSNGGTIASRRLLAGLDSVLLRSLNGGRGADGGTSTFPRSGTIQLTDRAGVSASVDLSTAETLGDVLAAINAAAPGITASVSASGLGLELRDTSGGAGPLAVADVGESTIAQELHIAYSGTASVITSGNLQRQYVSTTTRLAAMNHGSGVPAGKFRITDSTGTSAVVDLTQGNEVTLQDVIDEINSRAGLQVSARLNDTGDGLILEDTGGGGGRLTVTEEGGTTANALGILGRAVEGKSYLDGSFETQITVGAGDTLAGILAKIQSSGAELNATIINDGTGNRPYRLNLTSAVSGRDGQMAVDVGTTSLGFTTLTQARDAVVLFGSSDSADPLVLTSSTNTLSDVIPGVRLDLVASSDQPVTITVATDAGAIADDLSAFVAAFNNAISKIGELTRYNAETQTRSVLTGDATVRLVRDRLVNLVNRTIPGLSSTINRLSRLGVKQTGGSSLSFDEAAFRKAIADDPDAVAEFFTHTETGADGKEQVTGLGGLLKSEIERLTKGETGIIPVSEQAIESSQNLLNDRIAQVQTLNTKRRERMLAQFNYMEQVLSQLQAQQTALTSLTALLSSTSNSTSTA